jgi:outer membrane protein assembly factor BamB
VKPFAVPFRGLLISLVVLALAGTTRADNWPQWRGPNNDGICKETNIPTKWSADENIAWKLALPGMAGSTPAIWGDHIFLTSEDGTDLVLLAVSTEGKELWKRKLGSGTGRRIRRDEGNDASPSPSTDGTHVFATDGQGDMVCFDLGGKEVWRFNAQERYGKFSTWHGWHTTPVLYGDRLYLQLIHSGGARVVAIDKKTGKEVWNVPRKSDSELESEHSYASPCIWKNGDSAYLITHGGDYAIAHSLKDGSEIWRAGDLNPKENYNKYLRFVTSPVATKDLIVVPSAKNGPVLGVKPDAKGFVKTGSEAEQWRRPHGTPDVPSPLVYDGLVYLCRENGVLICLDARTGKEQYKEEKIHRDFYRASPVYADGKIYLTARDGTITVVKPGRKFEKLAVNRLPDMTTASPAIANGRIYIRGWKALYAIGPEKK